MSRHLPADLTIITRPTESAKYESIARKLPLAFKAIRHAHPARRAEPLDARSTESRAAAQALAAGHLRGFRLAVNEMKMGVRVIRTGIAIAFGRQCNTTIVYRSRVSRHTPLGETIASSILECLNGTAP